MFFFILSKLSLVKGFVKLSNIPPILKQLDNKAYDFKGLNFFIIIFSSKIFSTIS